MGKTIIYFLIIVFLISGVIAQNFKYFYTSNPYQDRYNSLNQSGQNGTFSNLTIDNLLVINSPQNCLVNTGMIGTNMTTSTCSNNITDWYRIGSDTVYLLGNVGIGTSTPTTTLQVIGNVNISNNLFIGQSEIEVGNIATFTGLEKAMVFDNLILHDEGSVAFSFIDEKDEKILLT